MKEEIQVGLLCHSEEHGSGVLPQVRPFSVSFFFLASLLWAQKLQSTRFAELLGPPVFIPEGRVTVGEGSQSIHPSPSHHPCWFWKGWQQEALLTVRSLRLQPHTSSVIE